MKGNKILYLVLIIAFFIRITSIFIFAINKISFGDAQDYIDTARFICKYSSYPDKPNMPFFRPPFLPFFICIVTFLNPERIWMIKLSFAVIDCLTIFVIFNLSILLFNNELSALISSILGTIYPVFLFQIIDIRTEPLFMFFLIASLYLFIKSIKVDRSKFCILSGIFIGLSSLTRPSALIIIPLICASYIFIKKKFFPLLFFIIGCAVTLFPWSLHNYIKYKEIIIVNNAFGYNFWRGSDPKMYKISKIKDQKEFLLASREFEENYSKKYIDEVNKKAKSPMERSKEWFKLGIKNVKEYPKIYIKYTTKKAIDFFRLWLNPQEYGKKKAILSSLIIIPLYLLGFIGLIIYRYNEKWLFNFIIIYFIIIWISHIPFQVVIRFRIPFYDPILIVFAGNALYKIQRKKFLSTF